MPTTKEVLSEIKSDVREAHSELRTAIKRSPDAEFVIFFDKDYAQLISDFLDAFLYE